MNDHEPSVADEGAEATVTQDGTPTFEFAFELVEEDYFAWVRHWAGHSRITDTQSRNGRLAAVAVAAIVVFSGVFGLARVIDQMILLGFAILGAIVGGAFTWWAWPSRWETAMERNAEAVTTASRPGTITGPRKVIVSDEGMRWSGPVSGSYMMWPGVLRVDTAHSGVYVFLSANQALIIPARAFENEAAQEAFATYVAGRIAATRD